MYSRGGGSFPRPFALNFMLFLLQINEIELFYGIVMHKIAKPCKEIIQCWISFIISYGQDTEDPYLASYLSKSVSTFYLSDRLSLILSFKDPFFIAIPKHF